MIMIGRDLSLAVYQEYASFTHLGGAAASLQVGNKILAFLWFLDSGKNHLGALKQLVEVTEVRRAVRASEIGA